MLERRCLQWFLALLLLMPFAAQAQSGWTGELFAGVAHSFGTDVTIRQSGFPELKFSADYQGQAFQTPIYYAWRISKWKNGKSWEVELIHLKVYVTNPPSNVQNFAISHGYNLLLGNRAWSRGGFILRVGAGVVIAHPETVVREQPSEPGYELTGPAVQGAVAKRFYLSDKFFVGLEGKLTIARAGVSTANGSATVPNVALHGLFGFGYVF